LNEDVRKVEKRGLAEGRKPAAGAAKGTRSPDPHGALRSLRAV
jgi:hypothetical protein